MARSGLASLLLALLLAAPFAAAAGAEPSVYTKTAIAAADWIAATAVLDANGAHWPVNNTGQNPLDLYSGVAGVAVFLLEAHRATSTPAYLNTAIAAGDYLLSQMEVSMTPGNTGLYHVGISGIGFSLYEIYKHTGLPRFLAGSQQVTEFVLSQAVVVGDGLKLHATNVVRWGAAGTCFYLLYLHHETGNATLLDASIKAGNYILTQGIDAAPQNKGLKWLYNDEDLPNYAEGTSGVAYLLLTLYRVSPTPRPDFLEAAQRAFDYLNAIAYREADGSGFLVYTTSSTPNMFYLGECNGPPGMGRFLLRFYEITGDQFWLNVTRQSHSSLMAKTGPKWNWVWSSDTEEPWWNNIGQCDGNSAAGEFLLQLYLASGDAGALRDGIAAIDNIVSRGTSDGANGMFWMQQEWRVLPNQLAAQVGYMQGAAGVGSLLLWLDAVLATPAGSQPDLSVRIPLPDSPFYPYGSSSNRAPNSASNLISAA